MDTLEYIDGFFKGEYPPEEAGQFEERIQKDPVFAEQVAYYLSAHAAFKELYVEEKKRRFRELLAEHAAQPAPIRHMAARRWVVAMSAAAIIAVLVLGWLVFVRPANGSKLADQYIRENLGLLSARMGTGDSVQTGVKLYNQQQYTEALRQFESILQSDSTNPTVLLDAGITALRMEDYDKALGIFSKLKIITDPHLNPALFYEAITLMRRHQAGDLALAKQLLHQIVKEKLDRRADAAELLGKL
ncbi:MAG TPA: tetratricopeptide repeat protein [Puia sp.]